MKSLKESLIGNIKRSSLNDGSDIKNLKQKLDSPEVLSNLTKQCLKFVGTIDGEIPEPVIRLDKGGKYIRFIFADFKVGVLQWELDWDKWSQFRLPKRIEISNFTNSVRFHKSPISAGIIRSKKGVVEDLELQVGDNKMVRIFFENGLIFKNCTFDNYTEFNILSKVDFSKPGSYLGYLNIDNFIYNQLTGSYEEKNLGFQWNHPKPVDIFKNCNFKYAGNVFPLYYYYKKEQAYGTNFFTINGILADKLKPDMPNFDIFSKDLHMKEIK